jgi:pyruvate formate lyase activating enzyme
MAVLGHGRDAKVERPLIVDVKRYSLEDGPGIRSVVFFKGCPLRCVFCQDPETQFPGSEIAFAPRKCISCGKCADVCPQGAIDLNVPGRIQRDRCKRCGKCASVCPGGSLNLIGTYYSPESLVEILLRDAAYYQHSGGGVTLSGGECTLYPEYLESLLKLLKEGRIHVVLETAGYFAYGPFERRILPYIDVVYYDLKLADSQMHREYVGRPNEVILDNFRRLVRERSVEVHPRIPLIPGVTATKENLAAIIEFLCGTGAEDVSLLPYNPMGIEMIANLGRPRPPLPERFMNPEEEREIVAFVQETIKAKGRPRVIDQNVPSGFHSAEEAECEMKIASLLEDSTPDA